MIKSTWYPQTLNPFQHLGLLFFFLTPVTHTRKSHGCLSIYSLSSADRRDYIGNSSLCTGPQFLRQSTKAIQPIQMESTEGWAGKTGAWCVSARVKHDASWFHAVRFSTTRRWVIPQRLGGERRNLLSLPQGDGCQLSSDTCAQQLCYARHSTGSAGAGGGLVRSHQWPGCRGAPTLTTGEHENPYWVRKMPFWNWGILRGS